MATLSELQLKFSANVAEITRDLSSIEKRFQQFSSAVQTAGKAAVAGFALVGIGQAFGKIVEGATSAEAALAQVEAAVKSTGGAAGITTKQIDEMANAMKRKTGVDDDAIKSMSSLLLTFTKINKDIFPETAKVIEDMSVRMKTDLNTSAIQVGKALQDPIKGVAALAKVGVSFSESQKAMIKSLVDTGQSAKAQAMILKELETEFGGSAAAARNTLGGALAALKQQVDDSIDAFDGARGLREVVEFGIVAMEDFEKAVMSLRDPNSKLSKDLEGIGKVLVTGMGYVRGFANIMINGFGEAWKTVVTLYNGFADLGAALGKLAKAYPQIGNLGKVFAQAFAPLNFLKTGADNLGAALQKAASKDNFGQFDSILARSKEKMAELNKEAANFKGPMKQGLGEDEGPSAKELKAAEKAAKKKEALVASEQKSLAGLLASYAQKNVELEAQLNKHKEIGAQTEAERKISGLTNLSLKDRLAAIQQIAQMTKQRVELERQIKVGEEKKKLEDILQGIKDQSEQLKTKNSKQEELLPLLNAEKQIREAVKVGLGENLELQKQIREAAAQQVELIKEQKHQEALKDLKATSDEYDKQLSSLQAKLSGQEDLLPLLEQEQKIRENINLTEGEKNDAIASNRQKFGMVQQFNQALEDQKKTIEDVRNSAGSYKDKMASLNGALASGRINSKQWNEVARDLWDTQKKTKTAADEVASTITSGLEKSITSGKGLVKGFKEMGKELALFAAKALLLKPLEAMIANLGNRMMGTGKYTPSPFGGGPGGFQGGQLAMGGNGFTGGAMMPAGGIAGLPNMGGGGGGDLYSQWLALKNAGYPVEDYEYYANQGGQLPGGGGGGGGLFGGLVNPFSANYANAAMSMNPQIAGYMQNHPILGRAALGIGGSLGMMGGLFKGLLGFWSGGEMPGGWAMTGEHGPEMVFANRGAYVATAAQTQQMSRYAQDFYNLSTGKSNFGDNTGAWMANNAKASAAFDAWRADEASQGKQLMYRDLWEQSQRAMAMDMLRRTNGTADSGSKGAMWAQSILSGENFGMWGGGGYGLASGNQQVEQLRQLAALGVDVSAAMPSAMGNDAVWNIDGDQYSTKGVGYLAQKSMQMGGGQYTGSTDLYAYGASAFDGGWGNFDEMQKQAGQEAYAQKVRNQYWKSVLNSNPLGGYIGGGVNGIPPSSVQGSGGNIRNYDFKGPSNQSQQSAYNPSPLANGGNLKGYVDNGWAPDGVDEIRLGGNRGPSPVGSGLSPANQLLKDNFDKNKAAGQGPSVGGVMDWMKNQFSKIDLSGVTKGTRNLVEDFKNKISNFLGKNGAPGESLSGDAWYKGYNKLLSDFNKRVGNPNMNVYGNGGTWGAMNQMASIATADTVFDQQFKSPQYSPSQYRANRSSSFDRWATPPIEAGRINARMRGYANGGIMRAGELAVVGENGKEFAMAASDTAIIPSKGLPGGFGGKMQVNIINNHPGAQIKETYNPDGTTTIDILEKLIKKVNGPSIPRRRA